MAAGLIGALAPDLKERRTALTKIGFLGIVLYVLVTGVHQRMAFSRWQAFLESQGIEYRDLAFADHPLGGPLSLRLWVDESGNVRKFEFGHRF